MKKQLDLKNLKSILFFLATRIWRIIKDTFTLPYAKTYLFLSIILTAIFTIFTFPYEVIIKDQLKSLEKTALKTIYLGYSDINLAGPSTIKDIEIVLKNNHEINIKELIIDPNLNPYTLLISQILEGDFQASKVKYLTKEKEFNFKNISSNFNLEVDFDSSSLKDGFIKMMVQNIDLNLGQIKVPTPLGEVDLPFQELKFSSLNFDSIINDKEFKINNFKLLGPDLQGELKGKIKINSTKFMQSVLELKTEINADSKILSNYKELLTSFINDKGKIVLPLKGSLERPRLDKNLNFSLTNDLGDDKDYNPPPGIDSPLPRDLLENLPEDIDEEKLRELERLHNIR